MTSCARLLAAAAIAAIATPAFAHSGGAFHVHGLAQGFLHPFGGIDHVLAMAAVGLWAGVAGGRALWAWPAAFVAAMTAAAGLGMAGLALPFGELGIIFSVVALPVLVVLGRRVPLSLGAAVCALFAVFHGWAHGAEMPADAAGLAYGMGFIAATTLLHAAGMLLSTVARPLLRLPPAGARS